MIRIFIGHDPTLSLDYSIAQESIIQTASEPVCITPVTLNSLKQRAGLTRARSPLQSNDFGFSRWLTPYLCGYDGWALFVDSDVIFVDDVANLWALKDDKYSIQVVKHRYNPKTNTKFLENVQTTYQKKNWSSVVLFNNKECTALTPHYINTASGLDLHQFKWLQNDELIGDIPSRWNYLVGEDESTELSNISLLHYTLGTPLHKEYRSCDFSDVWISYYAQLTSQFK